MKKQEEIETIICNVIRHWNQSSFSANWQSLYGGITMSQDIMLALHSQGVVIKVDKELPAVEEDYPFERLDEQAKMLKWHNDSLEPLVKDD